MKRPGKKERKKLPPQGPGRLKGGRDWRGSRALSGPEKRDLEMRGRGWWERETEALMQERGAEAKPKRDRGPAGISTQPQGQTRSSLRGSWEGKALGWFGLDNMSKCVF